MKTHIVALFAFFIACKSPAERVDKIMKDEKHGLIAANSSEGASFHLQYLPPFNAKEDDGGIRFRFNVVHDKSISIGSVDSLLFFRDGANRVYPSQAERIANGNIRGTEYMVIFTKGQLKGAMELVFMDPVWMKREVVFHPDITAIAAINSIIFKK